MTPFKTGGFPGAAPGRENHFLPQRSVFTSGQGKTIDERIKEEEERLKAQAVKDADK
jgi:hypothetical protein